MLGRALSADGYDVETAADGADALVAVERNAPDLIVLDVAMEGLDGIAVCRRLRAKGLGLPVLLLTARDGIPDRVSGLDAGADDYLVKPFATDELLARVRALLRRGQSPATILTHGELTFDVSTREARVADRMIRLTVREAALLELFLRHARRVVTREMAIGEIWDGAATDNVVDRYVSNLRAKLGDEVTIDTIRGVGFVLR